jgi:hypothetical protein
MPSAASGDNSRNGDPGSSSAVMRSRASSLPRSVCLVRAFSPPPSRGAREPAIEFLDERPVPLRVLAEFLRAWIELRTDDGHVRANLDRKRQGYPQVATAIRSGPGPGPAAANKKRPAEAGLFERRG